MRASLFLVSRSLLADNAEIEQSDCHRSPYPANVGLSARVVRCAAPTGGVIMRAFLVPAAIATVLVGATGAVAADLGPPVIVESVQYCTYLDFSGLHTGPCRNIDWPGVTTGALPGGLYGQDPNGVGPPGFDRFSDP
jgi:hypothetical protein